MAETIKVKTSEIREKAEELKSLATAMKDCYESDAKGEIGRLPSAWESTASSTYSNAFNSFSGVFQALDGKMKEIDTYLNDAAAGLEDTEKSVSGEAETLENPDISVQTGAKQDFTITAQADGKIDYTGVTASQKFKEGDTLNFDYNEQNQKYTVTVNGENERYIGNKKMTGTELEYKQPKAEPITIDENKISDRDLSSLNENVINARSRGMNINSNNSSNDGGGSR